MKSKLLAITITLALLIVSINLAVAFDFDNIITEPTITKDATYTVGDKVLDYNPIWEKYAPIEIENWFGIGETLFKGAITQHTDTCGSNCISEMVVELTTESALVDDIYFLKNENGKWVESSIRSYGFYVWDNPKEKIETYYEDVCSGATYDEKTGEQLTEDVCEKVEKTRLVYYKLVDDYKYVCVDTGETSVNGTKIQDCTNEVVGSHEVIYDGYSQYSMGEIKPAGTYKIKLIGNKRNNWEYDWVLKTQGRFLESWATWGVSDLTSDLVAHYKSNTQNFTSSNQSIAIDSTGINNGTWSGRSFNDGNVSGGVTIEDGAMKFDASTTSKVATTGIPSNMDLNDTTSFSYSLWVNPTYVNTTSGYVNGLLGVYQKNAVGMDGSRRVYGGLRNNSLSNTVTSVSSLSLSSWSNVVVTYNSLTKNWTYYINGNYDKSQILTVTNVNLANSTQPRWTIGGRDAVIGGTLLTLNGSIDDVKIYNRVLSSSEIASQYALGRGKYAIVNNGLVAQYSGRDYAGSSASPTTIYDTNHLTEGKVNQGFNFDGADDYVNTTYNSYNENQTLTFSLWYNAKSNPINSAASQNILGFKYAYLHIRVLNSTNDQLFFRMDNTTAAYGIACYPPVNQTNVWNYVSGSYWLSNNLRYTNLSLNGVYCGTSVGVLGASNIMDTTKIGLKSGYFNGSIDDVRIYNRSLTSDEISYLYNSGTGLEDDANAYITLNSPADDYVMLTHNISFNASATITNGATLTNMSLWFNGILNQTRLMGALGTTNTTSTSPSSDTHTAYRGIKFVMNKNGYISKVSVMNGEGSTFMDLRNAELSTIERVAITGGVATFTNQFVSAGTTYYLTADAGGDNVAFRYVLASGADAFPVVRNNFNVTNSTNGGTQESSLIALIQNITFLDTEIGGTMFYSNLTTQTNWSIETCDSDGVCGFSENRTVFIDTTAPTITLVSGNGTQNYGVLTTNHTINYTITDSNLESCWVEYNGTNRTAPCTSGATNSTSLALVLNLYNATIWANDSVGNLYGEFFSWNYTLFTNSQSYNSTAYETDTENYGINVTGLTSANLIYNGTSYTGTVSGTIATRSLTLSDVGNKSIYWELNGGIANTSIVYQNVLPINLTLCDYSLYNNTYINFTFKDESTDGYIYGEIPTSTFFYWLGDGTVNKTLTYINNTGNLNFPFCFSPSDKNVTIDMYMQYKNSTNYPQRIYEPATFSQSNTTLQKVLYLLSITDGIYVTFQVINGAEEAISGVDVVGTRVIGTETTTVAQGTTDQAGSVTFWLNPDYAHSFTFTATGYDTYTTSITPTQSTYTINLGTATTSTVVDYSRGITQSIKPISEYLDKWNIYPINYTISSIYYNLDSWGFILKYYNGSIASTQSSSSSTGGTLNVNLNVTNTSKLIMNYYYVINSSYINGTRYWIVQSTDGKDYSLTNLFTRVDTYMDANILGINGEEGNDTFSRALISVLILILLATGLTYRYGIQSESAILGMMFGLILLLNTLDFIPNPSFLVGTGVELGELIAYLLALLTIGFIIREEYA